MEHLSCGAVDNKNTEMWRKMKWFPLNSLKNYMLHLQNIQVNHNAKRYVGFHFVILYVTLFYAERWNTVRLRPGKSRQQGVNKFDHRINNVSELKRWCSSMGNVYSMFSTRLENSKIQSFDETISGNASRSELSVAHLNLIFTRPKITFYFGLPTDASDKLLEFAKENCVFPFKSWNRIEKDITQN